MKEKKIILLWGFCQSVIKSLGKLKKVIFWEVSKKTIRWEREKKKEAYSSFYKKI